VKDNTTKSGGDDDRKYKNYNKKKAKGGRGRVGGGIYPFRNDGRSRCFDSVKGQKKKEKSDQRVLNKSNVGGKEGGS